jgi:hypothetical protein
VPSRSIDMFESVHQAHPQRVKRTPDGRCAAARASVRPVLVAMTTHDRSASSRATSRSATSGASERHVRSGVSVRPAARRVVEIWRETATTGRTHGRRSPEGSVNAPPGGGPGSIAISCTPTSDGAPRDGGDPLGVRAIATRQSFSTSRVRAGRIADVELEARDGGHAAKVGLARTQPGRPHHAAEGQLRATGPAPFCCGRSRRCAAIPDEDTSRRRLRRARGQGEHESGTGEHSHCIRMRRRRGRLAVARGGARRDPRG